MFVQGRIENFILIVDCKGIGVFNAPYVIFSSVLKVLQEYAKCKIKDSFCLNTEVGFGVVWKTLSLDAASREKVIMTGKNTTSELLDLVVPQQLERKFGGHVENKTKNYFPPREASYNYGFDKFRLEEAKSAREKDRRGSLKQGGIVGMKSIGMAANVLAGTIESKKRKEKVEQHEDQIQEANSDEE